MAGRRRSAVAYERELAAGHTLTAAEPGLDPELITGGAVEHRPARGGELEVQVSQLVGAQGLELGGGNRGSGHGDDGPDRTGRRCVAGGQNRPLAGTRDKVRGADYLHLGRLREAALRSPAADGEGDQREADAGRAA